MRQLPRELAPGLFWIGGCTEQAWQGEVLHSYSSAYILAGADRSVVVDTGHPTHWPLISRQLDAVLRTGIAPVTHLFPTHGEAPHAGNIGRLSKRFPEAEICGDVRDYHLIFPQLTPQLRPMDVGDAVELGGGATLVIVEAVIRDLVTSRWAYDTSRRVLFTGDGFAYMHSHREEHCGHTAEEVPDLAYVEMSKLMSEHALYWTRFTDVEPQIAQLHDLLRRYPAVLIAPGHGLPISDPENTAPTVEDGLRVRAGGGVRPEAGDENTRRRNDA